MAFPTSGLVVYYKLEDLTESVGGLNLTNNNGVTFGAGKVNNAATFVSASSQYLSVADNAAFQMGASTSFTLAAWLKFTGSPSFTTPVFYGQRNNPGYGFATASGAIRFGVLEGFPFNQAAVDTTTVLGDGNWHLVVGWCDRSSQLIKVYYDGSTHGSSTVSCSSIGSVNSTVGFLIGADKSPAADFFDGSVDEVGLWNRVLSDSEIDALWNGGAGITYSPVTDVTVNLTGVSATPAIGIGTVNISAVVPPVSDGLVAGGRPLVWLEDETVYLEGVAASPEVGKITPVGRGTLDDLARMFPFPRQPEAQKPVEMPPGVRRVFAKVTPPVVYVYPNGVQARSVIGIVNMKAFYEDIDEETIAMIDLL